MSRINYLLNKFAQGTCSANEFEELMHLLQREDLDQELRNALQKIETTLESELISDSRINKRGHIVNSGQVNNTFKILKLRKVAAIALIILGIPALIFIIVRSVGNHQKGYQKSVVSTPAGSKTSVTLPDGTKVWLNAKSTLTYTTGFGDGKREVALTGEAMFDVKHDSLHPFLVHTDGFDVTDLGTVFNIRAYPEDKISEAALISGSIEISLNKTKAKKIHLKPSQKLVLHNDSVSLASNPQMSMTRILPIIPDPQTQIAADTSWMVNKLIFKEETFGTLAMQLQRRYNVAIIFEKQSCSQYKFTGRFEDETIDEALLELQAIAPFSYRKRGNMIFISN